MISAVAEQQPMAGISGPIGELPLDMRRVASLADAMYWDSMSPVDGYYGKDAGNTSAIGSILIEHYSDGPDPDDGSFYCEQEAVAAWGIALARREGKGVRDILRSRIASGPTSRGDQA